MNYNNPKKNNSTILLNGMCAIVFTLFTWCYLFFFQADIIAVAQHVLSGGVTTYNRTVGAVLITTVLIILQLVVYSLTNLRNAFHPFTYLPSAVVLSMVTNIDGDIDRVQSLTLWSIALLVSVIVALVTVFAMRQLQNKTFSSYENVTIHTVWKTLLIFFIMFCGICIVANTDAVFHYRAKSESRLIEGDYDGAMEVGRKSLETDSSLTMIRVYALACKGELGERLFSYPIKCSGNAIVPMPTDSAQLASGTASTVRFQRYPLKCFYARLGACPPCSLSAVRYLHLLEKRGKATPVVKDYVLAIHLIDKDIDGFAKDFIKYYGNPDSVGNSMPRHYQEAMTLYRHQRTNPIAQYHNEVLETDYQDFQKLMRKYPLESERKLNAFKQYYGSYWYYFEFK